MWSFVAKKVNRPWIWIAMDAKTRQVIAFHVGDRSRESGAQLWAKVPKVYQQQAVFHTDLYEVYKGVERNRCAVGCRVVPPTCCLPSYLPVH